MQQKNMNYFTYGGIRTTLGLIWKRIFFLQRGVISGKNTDEIYAMPNNSNVTLSFLSYKLRSKWTVQTTMGIKLHITHIFRLFPIFTRIFLIIGKTIAETNIKMYMNIVKGSSERILLKKSGISKPPQYLIDRIIIP